MKKMKIGMGNSRTPSSVMGSQGKPVKIAKSPSSHSRPTGSKQFPGGMSKKMSGKRGGTMSKNADNC